MGSTALLVVCVPLADAVEWQWQLLHAQRKVKWTWPRLREEIATVAPHIAVKIPVAAALKIDHEYPWQDNASCHLVQCLKIHLPAPPAQEMQFVPFGSCSPSVHRLIPAPAEEAGQVLVLAPALRLPAPFPGVRSSPFGSYLPSARQKEILVPSEEALQVLVLAPI